MGWIRDRDTRPLALWVAAAVIALALGIRFFFVAFPEASLVFAIGPSDATRIARDFLGSRGVDVREHMSTAVMKADNDAKIYLEREVGLERASVLMASEVTVFAFEVRFFRDLQREEHVVRVDPAGRVVGLRQVLEEERSGARLDAVAARPIAEAFLRAVEPRASEYVFLEQEQSSIDRLGRRDWSFTWERRAFRAADAPYRITVRVSGDSVSGLEPALKVPDAWKRDFERLRSENTLYQAAATVGFVLTLGLVLATLIGNVRRGAVRWKHVLVLGGALAVVFTAMSLNALPLVLASYETTSSYVGYVLSQVVLMVVTSAFIAALIAVTFAAAEPLYRGRWPERLRLAAVVRPGALRTREMLRGLVIGLALAAVMFGGQILFYVVGRGFGVWAPQDVRYTDAVATVAPWLFPLGIGIQASTLEEGLFRLFAIPFLLTWIRWRALAVIVPAVVWGFGHSSYPVEPGYVRGIEVGLIGIAFGVVFLRWGLIPVLIAHYTFDAALIAMFLARSSNITFQVSALVVGFALVVPLLAAVALLARRRGFREDPALLNSADPVPQPVIASAAAVVDRTYEAAPERRLRLALAIGVTGLFLFIVVRPPEAIGDFAKVRVSPAGAERIADGLVTPRGADVSRMQRAVTLGGVPPLASPGPTGADPFDRYANEYLRQRIGVTAANQLYAEHAPSVFWRVRYFQDGVKDERTVLLRPDGTPYAVLHTRAEAEPGPDLLQDAARRIAESYMRDARALDLAAWRAVDATSTKLPQRTDHLFVYERVPGVDEANVRAEIAVSGDEVTGFRTFVKVPEAWQRARSEVSLLQAVVANARSLVIGSAVIAMLVMVLRAIRRRSVPWRPLVVVGAAVAVLNLGAAVAALPDALARYPTSVPFAQYLAVSAAAALMGALVLGAVALAAAAAAWLFAERAFGEHRLPSFAPPAVFWRDALLLGIAGAGVYLLWQRIPTVADIVVPVERAGLPSIWTNDPGWLSPALHTVGRSGVGAILLPLFALVIVSGSAAYLRRRAFAVAALVLALVAFFPDIWSPPQVARDLAVVVLRLAVVGVWVVGFARWNVLAYPIAVAIPWYAYPAIGLLRNGDPFYVANGIALLACAAVLIAVPFVLWRVTLRAATPLPRAVAIT